MVLKNCGKAARYYSIFNRDWSEGVRDNDLWQAVLGEIELSVSRASFVTWFKNTQLLRRSDEGLVIGVPNIFIKQQLERKFNDLITATLQKNGVEPLQIEYKIHALTIVKNVAPEEAADVALFGSGSVAVARPQGNRLTHAYRQV